MNFVVEEFFAAYTAPFSSDDDYDSTESFDFNTPPTPVKEKVTKLKNALTISINRIMYSPHKLSVEAFSIADSLIGLHDRMLLYTNIDTQEIYIPQGLYDLFSDNSILCSQENIKALFMHIQFLTMIMSKLCFEAFIEFIYRHLSKIKSALNKALQHFIIMLPEESSFFQNILDYFLNVYL